MNRRLLVASAASVLAGLAFIAPSGLAQSGATDTFFLDTYESTNDGAAGPVRSAPLSGGDWQVVRVEGTFSAWQEWPSRRCGKVEPAPVYRTPNIQDTPAGMDALFRFAQPREAGKACPSNLPRYLGVFQINSGSGFKTPIPVGGIPSKPTGGDHAYKFVTKATADRLRFRLKDWHTDDNNGRLQITVRAARDADCANGAFASFGGEFADEAACRAAL